MTLAERLRNLHANHARLSQQEALLSSQLEAVRTQKIRIEGAIELADALASAKPAETDNVAPEEKAT